MARLSKAAGTREITDLRAHAIGAQDSSVHQHQPAETHILIRRGAEKRGAVTSEGSFRNTGSGMQLRHTPPFESRARQHFFEAHHDVAGPPHCERLDPLFAARQTRNQNVDQLLLHGPNDLRVGECSWLGPREARGSGMYMQQMLSILHGGSQDLAAIRRCECVAGHCLAESGQ